MLDTFFHFVMYMYSTVLTLMSLLPLKIDRAASNDTVGDKSFEVGIWISNSPDPSPASFFTLQQQHHTLPQADAYGS